MILQISALSLKGNVALGRLHVDHHWTVMEPLGHSCRLPRMGSENAVARRWHRRTGGNPTIVMIIPISVMIDEDVVIDLPRIHQNIIVNDRHPTWDSLVNVMNVGDSYVVDVVVVVGDVRDIGDTRVADVHRLEVASADAIVGNVRFAVAKREPAYACTATADPCHESGRIAGTNADRTGCPCP
jgi:hypothetical protein